VRLLLRRTFILPLIVAFLGAGLGTLLASVFLETFLLRQLAKSWPDLSTWNRELNALSLLLASFIGGVLAIKLAQSSASLSETLPARLREMLAGFKAAQYITPLPPVWLRQAMAHDQPTVLASLSSPVLILAGETDWRVPPSEAQLLAEALEAAGHTDWELSQLPGVNHQLVVVDGAKAGFLLEQADAYASTRRPVAPAVLDALTEWLNQRK